MKNLDKISTSKPMPEPVKEPEVVKEPTKAKKATKVKSKHKIFPLKLC